MMSSGLALTSCKFLQRRKLCCDYSCKLNYYLNGLVVVYVRLLDANKEQCEESIFRTIHNFILIGGVAYDKIFSYFINCYVPWQSYLNFQFKWASWYSGEDCSYFNQSESRWPYLMLDGNKEKTVFKHH